MRVNKDLMGELAKALDLTPRRINQIISDRVAENHYIYSRNIIALDLAAEKRIDIRKYASKEELDELKAFKQNKTIPIPELRRETQKGINSRTTTLRFDREFEIDSPDMPRSVLEDAKKMAAIYPYLYVFENSARLFITKTMESKYGKKWWDEKVGVPIRKKSEDRQVKEGRNRWHGKRGSHPINYVDIDDLRSIITSNEEAFKDKLPDVKRPIEWVSNRIEEIELSRNIVAHNNPLGDDDIERIKVYFKDWMKQFLEIQPK